MRVVRAGLICLGTTVVGLFLAGMLAAAGTAPTAAVVFCVLVALFAGAFAAVRAGASPVEAVLGAAAVVVLAVVMTLVSADDTSPAAVGAVHAGFLAAAAGGALVAGR